MILQAVCLGGGMNSIKAAYAVIISMAAGMPMFFWLILGESGQMGEFGESESYSVIKYSLIALTCVFYFIVSPFVIWPRLFNGDERKKNGSDL